MNNSQELNQLNSVKEGDIFALGDNILGCGRAEDYDLIKRLTSGKKINCVVTDPPYGVAMVEAKEGFTNLSNKTPILNDQLQSEGQYLEFTRKWIGNVRAHLTIPNNVYIFNSDKMIFAVKQALELEGGKLSQLLIWVKNSSVMGRLDYKPQHELIAYGWFGKHQFYKSKDKSVLCYPKPQKSKFHPTTKPIPLIRHLILNSTQIGDVVWDGFGGSGTTLIACQQTRRICIMTEFSPDYCQTIISRFQNIFPGLPVRKLNT